MLWRRGFSIGCCSAGGEFVALAHLSIACCRWRSTVGVVLKAAGFVAVSSLSWWFLGGLAWRERCEFGKLLSSGCGGAVHIQVVRPVSGHSERGERNETKERKKKGGEKERKETRSSVCNGRSYL